MQGGAEHVFRLEGNHVDERGGLGRLGMGQPGLGGGNQQRRLGGISTHLVAAVVHDDLGIIAQQARTQALDEGRMFSGIYPPSFKTDFTFGMVSGAGDIIRPSTCVDRDDGHLVFGQGAGLIRANDGGAAERFDRRQFADDGAACRHARNARGQHDGDRRGQSLGNRSHGQSHRGHEHFHSRFTARHAHDEGEGGKPENDPKQQLAEVRDLAGERCGNFNRLRDQPRDAAGFGVIAGGPNQAFGLARRDERAGICLVLAICQSDVPAKRISDLGHGQGLAGQGGFVAAQVMHIKQSQVCRDAIARLQQDHIAGNEFGGWHAQFVAVPAHERLGGNEAAERIDRLAGAAFLDETDHRIHKDHSENDARVHPLGEEGGDS